MDHASRQTAAGELLANTEAQLADVERAIRSHRFLAALAEGGVPRERLRALAGEQWTIVASDRRAFALLASRFSTPVAGGFLLSMAQGEGEALSRLRALTAWLGLGEDDLEAYEPWPGCQAYAGYVSWLALNGSVPTSLSRFAANLRAWGDNCARVAQALRGPMARRRRRWGSLGSLPIRRTDLSSKFLAVLEEGLAAADSPARARRAARLLQAYEHLFWDTLAEGI